MEVDDEPVLQPQVARAKSFWMEIDVDQAFDELCVCVDHLRNAIKTCTATDREYIQGMNLMTTLDSSSSTDQATTSDSFVKVVIGGELMSVRVPEPASPQTPLPPQAYTPCTPPAFEDPLSPGYIGREDLLAPLPLHYQPHDCSQACVPGLPTSTHYLRWHNPLKVPLHCGFRRHHRTELDDEDMESACGEVADIDSDVPHTELADVSSDGPHTEVADKDLDGAECCKHAGKCMMTYTAPCGRRLRTAEEVLFFLLATGSQGVLQVDYFSFNGRVRLDCPRMCITQAAERDLSRGLEPTPVELFAGEGGTKPEAFRYRTERWPHGCFLSRGPMFKVCCDCTDGCLDAESCACIRRTSRGRQQYSHQRLDAPVATGLYECGPWCGCDRGLCQNRVVQRGLRVRLQVYQTADKGWGVRCRDDLDKGTFVCTYAGIVLRASQDSAQPPPSKHPRVELPSDDDVEVVTEWLAPAGKGRTVVETPGPVSPTISTPTSPPLHVPVIQRPADTLQSDLDSSFPQDDKVNAVVVGQQPEILPTEPDVEEGEKKKEAQRTTQSDSEPVGRKDMNGANETASPKTFRPNLEQNLTEHMYYLDATKMGNVGRFLNHHCEPNLFVQNVFTDSHDPNFPMIAFFTNNVVKAGSELTWNYSHDPGSAPEQEVPCLCGSDDCQEWMV